MQNQSDSEDDDLEEKIKSILTIDDNSKSWNEYLGIKLLILLPLIIFIIGLFVLNRPESIYEVLFNLIYPFILILLGVGILFVMRREL